MQTGVVDMDMSVLGIVAKQANEYKTYPVAEVFTSPQGEGFWVGTRMTFIRLAGCTVGKPYSAEERKTQGLQVYQERCTAWDGSSFACDTNYKMAQKLSINAIVDGCDSEHVCLTGGEPLMHDILPLLEALWAKKHYVHIETSGTISFRPLVEVLTKGTHKYLWVAVSPKQGYLPEALALADEIKVLVDKNFDEQDFKERFSFMIGHSQFYIQPVNLEHDFDKANIARCLEIQAKFPHVKISVQMHKVLRCR